jgi:hypothetical protein
MVDDITLQIQIDLQAALARIKSDSDPEKELIIDAIATLRQFTKEQSMFHKCPTFLSDFLK